MNRWIGIALVFLGITLTAARALADDPPAPPPAAASANMNANAPSAVVAKSELDEELPPDVRARLTPEQLHDVLIKRERHDSLGVETIVPVAFFVLVLAIVGGALLANYRKERLRHETLRNVIARGGEIPHELLIPQRHPLADLRRGIVLLAVGCALAILLISQDGARGSWPCALIPIFLGVAYVVVHRLEQKHRAAAPPAANVDPFRTPAS